MDGVSLTTTQHRGSSAWIYLIVIFMILFILVGVFLVYWFLIRKRDSAHSPLQCTSQNCPSGQYCSSTGQCIQGTAVNPGNICSENSDCMYGYTCILNYCTPNVQTADISGDFNLYVSTGNIQYYLVPNTNTQLIQVSTVKPTSTSFSYDSSNRTLTVNGISGTNNYVGSDDNGNLILTSTPFPLTLLGNNIIQIQHPCGSILNYLSSGSLILGVYFSQTTTGVCPNAFKNPDTIANFNLSL